MRATYILAVLAPALAVSAQSGTITTSAAQATSPVVSTCIDNCFAVSAIAAGCSSFGDHACICGSDLFFNAATKCLVEKEECMLEVEGGEGLITVICGRAFPNSASSIIASGSASRASITSSVAAGQSSTVQSLASVANSSVGVLTQSVASAASGAFASATATSAAVGVHHLSRGAVFNVGVMLLGAIIGPLALFA